MTNKRIAVFPGSFDPFTIGHEALVNRTLDLFDEIIIAIGINSTKHYMFPVEKREAWIKTVFANQAKVKVKNFEGLTVDFCKQNNAGFIIRGVRTSTDFEFEKAIAQMNRTISDVETIFIMPLPEHSAINSTIIRDIVRNNGDASMFVPKGVNLK
ncbi:MAG TPA: pantetheine-phosphate adenylyltransferase [Bacteroidia bacterium]|jgi:pantetheine-phosphate adenylyltransferase|nr:pantetheine-phosphate adenylyltransferase [Bacteroidia bacterium]